MKINYGLINIKKLMKVLLGKNMVYSFPAAKYINFHIYKDLLVFCLKSVGLLLYKHNYDY